MEKTYEVKGMSCVICKNAVEKGLKNISGVTEANVNLMENEVTVIFDETKTDENVFYATLKPLGYELVIGSHKKTDRNRVSLFISIVLMAALMYIAMSSMHNPENTMYIQLIIAALILILNRKYYVSGFRALFKLSPNMDTLVGLSSAVSFIYSIYIVISKQYLNGNHLYFETSAMVPVLVTIGKRIEERNRKKTARVIRGLTTLIPMQANLMIDNEIKIIPIDDLKKNDIIVIKAGESIPQDAEVIEGSSNVDESLITGESLPSHKEKGSMLIGGTVNTSGQLVARVTKNATQTVLSSIISLTKQAAMKKIPIERFADKVSGYFVYGVLGIALTTFIIWYSYTRDIEMALNFSMSVLVISCPCALGLATPSAIAVASATASKNGILIKNPEILETAYKLKNIILDKTGTLTENRIEVIDYKEYDSNFNSVVNALERNSSHPIAKAILAEFKDTSLVINAIKEISGEGIESNDYWAGNEVMATRHKALVNDKDIEKANKESCTFIIVGNKDKVLGVIYLFDRIKTSSYKAIKLFNMKNISSIMATGDNETVAKAAAARLHISEYYANVKPEDKQSILLEAKENGLTAMVGDGINDAIALSSADVSITLSSATDIAQASSDVVLLHNNISDIAYLIDLSKLTMRKIKQNLLWALIYNALFIPLAAGALYPTFGLKLNPMIGALTMSVSSIFVLSNALTISKLKKEEIKMNKTVTIEGMMCIHCQSRVEKALKELGVDAVVSHEKGTAVISNTEIEDSAIIKAIEDAGYEVKDITND